MEKREENIKKHCFFNKDLKSANININNVFFKLSEWLIPSQNKWFTSEETQIPWVLHQEEHPAKNVPNQNMWSYLLWKPLVNKKELKVALLK